MAGFLDWTIGTTVAAMFMKFDMGSLLRRCAGAVPVCARWLSIVRTNWKARTGRPRSLHRRSQHQRVSYLLGDTDLRGPGGKAILSLSSAVA